MSENYAIIATGGKQERVKVGQRLKVELLGANEGETVKLDKVLLIKDGEAITLGAPYIEKAEVTAKVLRNGRHDKIDVIKFKRRKKYRRKQGHRQHFSEIEITAI